MAQVQEGEPVGMVGLQIVQIVSGNLNVLLKNFCEKREYIGSKTRNCAMKGF